MRSLWRISNRCDLQGMGGEKSDGRWHTAERGKRVVYLSEHAASALIEVLASLRGNANLFPDSYQLMKVNVADHVAITKVDSVGDASGRRDDLNQTRHIGDTWLARGHSALMAVPSFPSPESVNYLFNPRHPDSRGVAVEWCKWMKYDKRLFHVSSKES